MERIWNRAFQLLLLEEWIWEHDNETRKTLWKPYCTAVLHLVSVIPMKQLLQRCNDVINETCVCR